MLRPRILLPALAALAALLAASPANAQRSVPQPDAFVSAPVVDLLSKPDPLADVTSQALYGSGVKILEHKGDFYSIHTFDDYTGWVAAAQLTATKNYAPTMHVSALAANLYREPDVTLHAPLVQLPFESQLDASADQSGSNERWLAVKLLDGGRAWIQRGDVATEQPRLTIPQMLDYAHHFLGITYTWGGLSTHGYDCSGFTQMLERQRGILMPRDADVQAAWSGLTAVDRAQLAPGDLLFFGKDASHITHTGMYIGNGDFIHDTPRLHPGVQISHLDDAPWTTLLVAARRTR